MSQRVLTTESGAPVADNQNSATAGAGGPLLIQDQHLLEKLARFNRERIPERVVHARGSGAYGYFEVTDDVTGFTRADFLSEVGRRTETFIRFSTVADSLGGADAVRDPRGSPSSSTRADATEDRGGVRASAVVKAADGRSRPERERARPPVARRPRSRLNQPLSLQNSARRRE